VVQTTIYESLREAGYTKLTRHTGDIGMEIETESKKAYEVPDLKYWSFHADGSLRNNGIEYIHKAPVTRGRQLKETLQEWDENINKKVKLDPNSYSTSVHVHINFLNNTWLQLANFITTYYSVENFLIRLSGPDRVSNLFCLPICDCEGELPAITSLISNIGMLQHRKLDMSPEHFKYSAMNICNLTKLGTMESRSLRGTLDITEQENWVETLLRIKDFAMTLGLTPPAIVEMADKQGLRFLDTVFGDKAKQFESLKNVKGQILTKEDREKLFHKNLYYAAKIAGSSKFNNDQWGFPKPKKIYKQKFMEQLNKLSMQEFNANFEALQPHMRLVIEEMLTRSLNVDVRNVVFAEGEAL